jgi:hypothetical protein
MMFGRNIVEHISTDYGKDLVFVSLSDGQGVRIAFRKSDDNVQCNGHCEVYFGCASVDLDYDRLFNNGVPFKSELKTTPWENGLLQPVIHA